MNKDILLNAFPRILKSDVAAVLQILPKHTHYFSSFNQLPIQTFKLDKDELFIPSRIYYDEPDSMIVGRLTDVQRAILNCIYIRHHDGFIRQKSLEALGERSEYWTVPYTLQLLGEYVYEILEVLDKLITERNIENFSRLTKENPKFWQQTESRIISYWHAYYRRPKFPRLQDYLGTQIADRIRSAGFPE